MSPLVFEIEFAKKITGAVELGVVVLVAGLLSFARERAGLAREIGRTAIDRDLQRALAWAQVRECLEQRSIGCALCWVRRNFTGSQRARSQSRWGLR